VVTDFIVKRSGRDDLQPRAPEANAAVRLSSKTHPAVDWYVTGFSFYCFMCVIVVLGACPRIKPKEIKDLR